MIEEFTPIAGVIGGILIGIATSLMLWQGHICGLSRIFKGFLEWHKPETLWRRTFILGVLSGALLMRFYDPDAVRIVIPQGYLLVVIAGLLVGFGSGMAPGCTSSHGLCGLGRLSKRSIVAVLTFLSTAMFTASLYHVLTGGVQ